MSPCLPGLELLPAGSTEWNLLIPRCSCCVSIAFYDISVVSLCFSDTSSCAEHEPRLPSPPNACTCFNKRCQLT